MKAGAPPTRSTYVPQRVSHIFDSPLNPDYLALHPKIVPLRELLTSKAPSVIVDVGCGSKRFAGLIRQLLPHSTYLGGDLQNNKEGNVDVLFSGAHRLPFKDRALDMIICNQVLEHVERPAESLAEAYRVLKKGGVLFLATSFLEHEHEVPFDFFRYTRFGLDYLFQNAGFEKAKIHIRPMGGAIAAFGQNFINFMALREKPSEPGIVMLAKKLFFFKPALYSFNRMTAWLDATYHRPNPVIGYIVTAEK